MLCCRGSAPHTPRTAYFSANNHKTEDYWRNVEYLHVEGRIVDAEGVSVIAAEDLEHGLVERLLLPKIEFYTLSWRERLSFSPAQGVNSVLKVSETEIQYSKVPTTPYLLTSAAVSS